MFYGQMNFSLLRRGTIHFGSGQADNTAAYIKEEDVKKVYVVTDKGLVATGMVDKILQQLEDAGIEYKMFDDVKSDAPTDDIDKCADEAKTYGADGILGIGGGSVLDSTKCINMLMTNPGSVREYFQENEVVKIPKLRGKRLFQIATTAGTGAEVTSAGVVNDVVDDRKKVVFGPEMAYDHAIVDPLLTVGLPPKLTAWTGLDCLTHLVGPYTNNSICEFNDAIHESGFKRVGLYLERAYKDGNDMEARIQMMYASMLGGLGMVDSWCHLEHIFAHEVGDMAHLHHGLLCALGLPHAMKVAAKFYPDRIRTIGMALGYTYPSTMTSEELQDKVFADFKHFNTKFDIYKLSDYVELTDAQKKTLFEMCPKAASWRAMPGPITEEELWELVLDYTS